MTVKRIYPGRGRKNRSPSSSGEAGKAEPSCSRRGAQTTGEPRTRVDADEAGADPRSGGEGALRWLPGMAAGSGGVTAGPPRSCRGERHRRGERWPAAAHQQLGDTGGRAAAGAKVPHLPPTFSQSIPASPPAPSFFFFFSSPTYKSNGTAISPAFRLPFGMP